MSITMQTINFITQFFLEILRRHCILIILSTLGMSGHTHQKRQDQFIDNWDAIYTKNNLHPSLSLRYCKDFANLLFWVIWAGLVIPKINGINLWDSLMFIWMQKINFRPHFFSETLQTCYFGYFGDEWLWPVKTLPTCRELWCYLRAKNHIFPASISSNIINILQTYYFGYFNLL